MIKEVRLRNFKGFEQYKVRLGEFSVLLGPNNAGKSTILEAIRGAALMLRYAKRLKPAHFAIPGEQHLAYPLDAEQFDITSENLRHEFRDKETRVEVTFANGSLLSAVWPTATDGSRPYFQLVGPKGIQPHQPRDVKNWLPSIGMIPVLTPIERNEQVLDEKYIRRNLSGHLASRHFRNQLYFMQEEPSPTHINRFREFAEWCSTWLPEIQLVGPSARLAHSGRELDLHYRDSRIDKEIAWAGGGAQVFLQFLLHIFRLRDENVVVLDEPDVYLHPDLQRRVIGVLQELRSQVILATHSAEVASEAPETALIWVDKSQRRAIASPDEQTLAKISASLGTGFNLRLARVLRAKLALFVEGDDMVLLRMLARTLDVRSVADEIGVAIIPIEGRSNYRKLEGFGWLADHLLRRSIPGVVVLDRDYHSNQAVEELTTTLQSYGLEAHVWHRKEVESYLLEPDCLARLSRTDAQWISQVLHDFADDNADFILSRFQGQHHEDRRDSGQSVTTSNEQALHQFRQVWQSQENRLHLIPPKEALARLNERLRAEGKKTLSFRTIARNMSASEVPQEVGALMRRLNALANADVEGLGARS